MSAEVNESANTKKPFFTGVLPVSLVVSGVPKTTSRDRELTTYEEDSLSAWWFSWLRFITVKGY